MPTTAIETLWVVLGGDGRVVLMCAGADAADVAEEWRQRGYDVVPMPPAREPAA